MSIPTDLLNLLMVGLQVFLALLGGFLAAFHISLVIWTFRDIRARSRDAFAHLLAAALVLLFSLPGLLVYMILRPRETLADQYERALEEEALLQDIEERLVCPGCQRKIEPDFMLCPSCQTVLKARCAHCDRLLHPKWQVCPYCTTPVGVTPPPPESFSKKAERPPQPPESRLERPAAWVPVPVPLPEAAPAREPVVPAWEAPAVVWDVEPEEPERESPRQMEEPEPEAWEPKLAEQPEEHVPAKPFSDEDDQMPDWLTAEQPGDDEAKEDTDERA